MSLMGNHCQIAAESFSQAKLVGRARFSRWEIAPAYSNLNSLAIRKISQVNVDCTPV